MYLSIQLNTTVSVGLRVSNALVRKRSHNKTKKDPNFQNGIWIRKTANYKKFWDGENQTLLLVTKYIRILRKQIYKF